MISGLGLFAGSLHLRSNQLQRTHLSVIVDYNTTTDVKQFLFFVPPAHPLGQIVLVVAGSGGQFDTIGVQAYSSGERLNLVSCGAVVRSRHALESIPKRRQARVLLEAKLCDLSAGRRQPESAIPFFDTKLYAHLLHRRLLPVFADRPLISWHSFRHIQATLLRW